MRAVTLSLLLSCAASSSAVAGTWSWSDLWSTPEQQGQRLLDSKQAAEAAPLFKDPRRRGYAESSAGQYAKAAKSLAPLHDTDSLYNRGNALAHTGQLRDALAAYDKALAQSPDNRDIVRNRDLVARALQQQQGNPQGGSGGKGDTGKQDQQGKQGQGGGQGNQSGSQGQSQAGNQGQSGSQGQNQASNQGQPGTQGQSQADNRSQQGAQGQSQAANQGQPGAQGQNQPGNQGQPGAQGQSQPGNQSAAAGQARSGEQGQGNAAGASQNDAQAVAQNQPGQTGAGTAASSTGNPTTPAGEAIQPPSQPRSEQALALDQWLRGIPDDSGELLRRKFLIEHMMKQRGNEP
jgi:Ca-activated chloride channel homolog